MNILKKDFYERSTLRVSSELLGKILVHETNGTIVAGKIVETEAYLGAFDKAAHAYKHRKTNRVKVMYGPGGTCYVYSIYGKYVCVNAITETEGNPQGVLIRAVEPLIGLDYMSIRRYNKPYITLNCKEINNLTSGPSKLCIAMNITKDLNNTMLTYGELYIAEANNKLTEKFEREPFENTEIIRSKRVGVDYAEEARDYLFRFLYKNNPFVSKGKKYNV